MMQPMFVLRHHNRNCPFGDVYEAGFKQEEVINRSQAAARGAKDAERFTD
jgi:hypothetical protein